MIIQIREILSALFVKGSGIEIGAFHSPWPLAGAPAKVLYVDNKDETLLRKAHPDLPPETKIVPIDRFDNGVSLSTFPDDSLDFILASHFLEHTPCILTTINTHLQKLSPGGLAIYAVPNRDNPIDKNRKTVFDAAHLIRDLRGPDVIAHHDEYLRDVDGITDGGERVRIAKERLNQGLDIHYHCFTAHQWLSVVLGTAQAWFEDFTVEFFLDAQGETFFVLRKR